MYSEGFIESLCFPEQGRQGVITDNLIRFFIAFNGFVIGPLFLQVIHPSEG